MRFKTRSSRLMAAAIAAGLLLAGLFAPQSAVAASNGLPAKCMPSSGCIMWAVPDGVDPLAGQTASVLQMTGPEFQRGVALLKQRSSDKTDHELVEIRQRAEQGNVDEAQARLDDWFAVRAQARTSSAAAGPSAGAGVGSVSYDLWSWDATTNFGMNATLVGIMHENWRQYLSEPTNSTTNRFIIDFTKDVTSPTFNVVSVTTQCREDKFTDSNCSTSPAMGSMGYYASSWHPDKYWTTNRSSQKKLLNFHYSVRWSTTGSGYTWQTTNYTTWRFNCGFASPYCEYTGSS